MDKMKSLNVFITFMFTGIFLVIGNQKIISQENEQFSNIKLIDTVWTWVDLSDDPDLEQDWLFSKKGIIVTLNDDDDNNTWIKAGDFVFITINDNYAAYLFKIVSYDLMTGIGKNITGLEWPVELRKKQ